MRLEGELEVLMNRLTDNDRNIGPFTIGRWSKTFAIRVSSGDRDDPDNYLLIAGFGWALRMRLPRLISPAGKHMEYEREFGVSLSDMGNGYDFLQVFFGPQTHDSTTTKSWCKHLPWKQWRCVRHSVYHPDGTHFFTEERGGDFRVWMEKKEACPSSNFGFEDFDGEMIVATCIIEEREWHRGEGWFKWLRHLYTAKIRRSLDIRFSAEVGPEKGSWKGGTVGHGIDMLDGETPRMAFERYCAKTHKRKGREYSLRFIGPCASHVIA